jgi:DNA repair exonuclease SbcCD ATPase subunit
MKGALAEKNMLIKDLQKEVNTLEKNERTLLDKINKFERELESLQNSIQANPQPIKSQPVVTFFEPSNPKINEPRKSLSRKKETFYEMANPQISSPYTIGKVIQLSTKILDLKIEINQYIQANAELQEEVDNLNSKIEALENEKRAEEDLRSEKSRNSEGSKNLTIRQIEHIRKENRKLNKINEDLKRKQTKCIHFVTQFCES